MNSFKIQRKAHILGLIIFVLALSLLSIFTKRIWWPGFVAFFLILITLYSIFVSKVVLEDDGLKIREGANWPEKTFIPYEKITNISYSSSKIFKPNVIIKYGKWDEAKLQVDNLEPFKNLLEGKIKEIRIKY